MEQPLSNLFAYGTLMCLETMQKVAGCLPGHLPAVLYGYRRLGIRGADYPGIIPCGKEVVQGICYLDIPVFAWQRLDDYEGELYERRLVRIHVPEDLEVPAFAYVVRQEFIYMVEPCPVTRGQ